MKKWHSKARYIWQSADIATPIYPSLDTIFSIRGDRREVAAICHVLRNELRAFKLPRYRQRWWLISRHLGLICDLLAAKHNKYLLSTWYNTYIKYIHNIDMSIDSLK